MRYLDLADFCAIAGRVLGVDPKEAEYATKIGSAESALAAPAAAFGDTEFYPTVVEKAAILCSRIVRNHPLPDGNKRTARVAMREFLMRNGCEWEPAPNDPDESVEKIESLAAGTLSEADFTAWVAQRIKDGGET